MPKLTDELVSQTVASSKEEYLWCSENPGFGVRIYPPSKRCHAGKKVFIAQYRLGQRQRRPKLGLASEMDVATARARFHELMLQEKPRFFGNESDYKDITVGEIIEIYMNSSIAGDVITRFGTPKSASSLKVDSFLCEKHLSPVVGRLSLNRITARQLNEVLQAPSRALLLLKAIFAWAIRNGYMHVENPLRRGTLEEDRQGPSEALVE
jgi:hypothetical protein